MDEAEGNNRSHAGSAALADARSTPLDRLETTPLEIGGDIFHIGELGLDEVIVIARVLGEAAVGMSATQKSALRDLTKATDVKEVAQVQANLLAFLQLLDPPIVRRVFGALLDRNDQWVRKHLKLRDAIRVVAAVLNHNDLDGLRADFFEVTKHFGALLKSSPPSSGSSPPTGSPRPKRGATASAGSRR